MFTDKTYKKHVTEGRRLIKLYRSRSNEVSELKNKVADLAIKVKPFCKLTVFCADIDPQLPYTTLCQWINDRTLPTNQITEKEGKNIDKGALNRTKKRVSRDTSRKEAFKIYSEEKAKEKEDVQLDSYVAQIKDIRFFICEQVNLKLLSKPQLYEILFHSLKISEKLSGEKSLKTRGKEVRHVQH